MLTVRDTGRTALADMRRMLGVLRDDEPAVPIPQPGIAQLDDLISRSRKAGVPAHLSVEGPVVPLSPGLELTIYRVVQECLTNVGRHAGPVTRVAVRIGFRMVLEKQPGIEIVGEAADGNTALELLTRVTADVVLMDVRMPRVTETGEVAVPGLADRQTAGVVAALVGQRIGVYGVRRDEQSLEDLFLRLTAAGAL